jgi:ribose transport system ATP-binding protein
VTGRAHRAPVPRIPKAMTEQRTLLDIRSLTKTFPGVIALEDVEFNLAAGEIHCLVGENGAGKSTFIKILSGALAPDRGSVELFGRAYRGLTPRQAIDLGIQTVYQESILVGTLTVAENVYLGHENLTRGGFFDSAQTARRARSLMDSLGIGIDERAVVSELSTAERQIVGIVKALSKDARILVLDEPTASLSSTEKTHLLGLLRKIASTGVGIIYISHHLDEVFEVADRITVLKDGRRVGTHAGRAVDQAALIREMVGRDASVFYSRERIPSPPPGAKSLSVQGYTRAGAVKEVSFEVAGGEIFGIGGMVGSGRTELVRLLFGLDRRDAGRLLYDGKDITPASPLDAIRSGMCLITEDRQKTGLILVRSVKENAAIARLNLGRAPFVNLREEAVTVGAIVERLRVMTPSIHQEVVNLSGGNQQKVVLAKWMLTNADIFLFDEPTRGIDIGAKEEIYRLMVSLAREGKVVIMVSSDMPELTSMSDRVAVMRGGRMVRILDREEATEETILSYSIGAGTP